jgi:hypothetical protein
MNIRLYTEGELIEYRRRWPIWRPVAVTALGAALIGGGVLMTLQARSNFDSFDQRVRDNCSMGGCFPDKTLTDLKDRGNTYQKLAAISYTAGGVALAAGIALFTVDRSVPYRIDPEGQRRDVASRGPLLAPYVGPGMAGLVGTGTF